MPGRFAADGGHGPCCAAVGGKALLLELTPLHSSLPLLPCRHHCCASAGSAAGRRFPCHEREETGAALPTAVHCRAAVKALGLDPDAILHVLACAELRNCTAPPGPLRHASLGCLFMQGAGGLAGWRWLFLLEGIPSVLLGLNLW